MRMQRSTAKLLVDEISEALQHNSGEIITLNDYTTALINDAVARENLQQTIGNQEQ
jgi:hypothetical protein